MEIINIKDNYDVLPVNAITHDDTLIPGIKGKQIDIDKSYNNMKLGGIFREEALIFKDLYPNNSIKNNYDKYIINGNSTKKQVSIIYILNNNYINNIKDIDNVTIFINHKDLNIKNINLLKEKEIYTYGNNGVYSKEILDNDNTLISGLSNNKSSYCLTKEKNNEVLKLCSNKSMHTVIPTIIGGYYEIKNKLSNGNIILLDNLNDIDTIIKYIKGKGYNIVSLGKLLSE